jgi:hypothetical protein
LAQKPTNREAKKAGCTRIGGPTKHEGFHGGGIMQPISDAEGGTTR